MRGRALLVALGWLWLASCTSGGQTGEDRGPVAGTGTGGLACADGDEGCPCYGNGTCNDDLTCASHLCVRLEGLGGGPTASGGAAGAGNPITGGTRPSSGGTVASGGTGGTAASGAFGGTRSSGGEAGTESSGGTAGTQGGAESSGGTAGTQGGADSSGGAGGDSSGGTGGSVVIPTDPCEGQLYVEDTCVAERQEVEPLPIDILLVMDRSTSMGYESSPGVTRLDLVSEALQTFATDSESNGIGIGLVFFRALTGDVCDPASYETPDVPIDLLASNVGDLTGAIDGVTPSGLTPVIPALEGAVSHARQHALDTPGRATVVALVSDAYPTECGSDPAVLSATAQAAYEGDPSIPVYTIGVGASARFNLDNVARAGGTGQTMMTDDSSTAEDFVNALRNITLSNLTCDFGLPQVPAGMELVIDGASANVQMLYTPFTGATEEMPYVGSLSGCASSSTGGWYVDNVDNPTRVRACPCTCARFGAGTLELGVGCRAATPTP